MGGIGTGNGHRKQAQLNKYLFHFEQSPYIEVEQGDIFMEQKMRFGLVLGRLAILKKNCADYEQLFRQFLHVFRGKKRGNEGISF